MKDERKLERDLRKFLEEQFERVKREIRKDDAQYQRKSVFQPSFWDSEKDRMWSELAEDFVGVLINGMNEGVIALSTNASFVDFDLINQALIDYAKVYRDEWLYKITETSRNAVQKAVTDWLESGESFDSLVAELTNTFGKARAERIAATEVTRLRSKANQLTWQQSGVVEEFRWSTVMDSLVCPICEEREGLLFPLSQMDELLPAHVNCRCVGRPVVSEALYEQRLDQILGL
jgi:SPP1 gp7 family putative phage head morphogenesis protein